jgi:hypothetical protein
MKIRAFVAVVTFLVPTTALAMGLGPPLSVPARPDAPPELPVTGTPPVLDITLPARPPQAPIPTASLGMPEDLPGRPFAPPMGVPDLVGIVDLPTGAAGVLALAPPFGASSADGSLPTLATIPEPATASLLALGLVGLARWSRRRR